MKKCEYCETKKMICRSRSPGRILSQCDYCKNRNKLAEERNAKIMREKRYAIVDDETVIFGIQCE
jgi:hypothetical protein